jgi:hypothetical protein
LPSAPFRLTLSPVFLPRRLALALVFTPALGGIKEPECTKSLLALSLKLEPSPELEDKAVLFPLQHGIAFLLVERVVLKVKVVVLSISVIPTRKMFNSL